MAVTYRLTRRAAGGAATPPASLLSGQLAFNEQNNTLYYGKGDNGSGVATSILSIGGSGATGTWGISISGNAETATRLQTARTINGTSFNGSANITTANWGTARTLTVGNTGKSVNGSANVSWSLTEIGALPLSGGTLTGALSIPTVGTTIGGATFDNGWLRVGNSTQGLTIDNNEIYAAGTMIVGALAEGSWTINAIPNFNGGITGSTAPFTVDSTFLVTNLNADLLDGVQGGSYLRSDVSDSFNTNVNGQTASFKMNTGLLSSDTGSLAPLEIQNQSTTAGDAFMTFHLANRHARYFGIDSATNDLFTGGWSAGAVKHRIWHAGNDGSGSGLDADLLDGENLDDAAATANTVVGRNGSGDIFARLIRQTHTDEAGISGGMVYRVNNSTDNYLRVCNNTVSIRTYLNTPTRTGGDASGTWGISVTGNAATATTLQTARTINGTSFNGSANINVPNLVGTNGTTTLASTGVTSGVNYLTTTNAITTNPVLLSTAGAATNIGLTISTKGTGAIIIDTGTGAGQIDLKPGSSNVRIWDDNSTHYYQIVTGDRTANYNITLPAGNVTLVSGTMVPTTGTGATGSWGISVTGSSASCTGNAATVTNGLYTTTSFGGDVSGTYNTIVVANDSHTHAFNNLTSKTSGTGDYTTTGTFTGATFNATSTTNGGFQGIDADSATNPSFTWSADLNTGMYRVGSDSIGFTVGGVNRVTIDGNTISCVDTLNNYNTSVNSFFVDYNLTGSTALTANRTQTGILVDLDHSSTGGTTTDGTRESIVGIRGDVDTSGTPYYVYGVLGEARSANTTGTIAHLIGVRGYAEGDSGTGGTTTSVYGIQGEARDGGAGTVTNVYGASFLVLKEVAATATLSVATAMRAEVEIDANTITTTKAGEFIIDNDGGTLTNAYLTYGAYEGTIQSGCWNLYYPSDAPSFVNGEFRLGANTDLGSQKLQVTGDARVTGTITATTFTGALSGNATTATRLQTAWAINGTTFNGSAAITTANWGTARTLTVGNAGKSVNGAGDMTWSLAEIGALPLTGGVISGALTVNGDLNLGSSAGNRYIDLNLDNGTTNFTGYIRTTQGDTLHETAITIARDGAVTLYFDNAIKLATTSTGAAITGTLTATGNIETATGTVRTEKINPYGTQLVLLAGESDGKVAGQTGEYVYINAEGGLSVNTPDAAHSNWEAGYTVDTTIIRGSFITVNGNTVWHAGNDGTGSGLDADLLDGVQGSSYLRSDASDTVTGSTTWSLNNASQIILNKPTTTSYAGLSFSEAGDVRYLLYVNNSADGALSLQVRKNGTNMKGVFNVDNNTGILNFTTAPTSAGFAILHAGNVGSYALPISGGELTGNLIVKTAGNAAVEIGRRDGVASTPFIDFNSGATLTDYDVRLIAAGGNGAAGGGTLTITAAATTISGELNLGSSANNRYIDLNLDNGTTNFTGYIRTTQGDTLHENAITIVRDGAVTLFFDNVAKLETTSAGAKVTGALEVTSTLDVNGQINVGTTPSNKYIDFNLEDGVTDYRAYFRTTQNDTAHENAIQIVRDGEVILYHDGSTRFATSAAGATVTGDLTVSGSSTAASFVPTSATVPTNGMYLPAGNTVGIAASSSQVMRLRPSGISCLGQATLRLMGAGITPGLQLEGNSNVSIGSIGLIANRSDSLSSRLCFLKSRGTSYGSHNIVQNGDRLGEIYFDGADGASSVAGAIIKAEVDGTPGLNDMPGRIVLSTTSDGASTPTERMRIDSSGRVLVGTSTVVQGGTNGVLQVANARPDIVLGNNLTAGVVAGNNLALLRVYGNSGSTYQECARIAVIADGTHALGDKPSAMIFSTTADGASSTTEAMRIDNKQIIYGKNASDKTYYANTGTSIRLYTAATSATGSVSIESTSISTTSRFHLSFSNPSGVVGSISTTSSATAYNTSSDYRLKENITSVADGISRLKQLKPSRFNFIADPSKIVDGFIAHEVQSVVPEAVTGEKDEVDDDGNPQYQGIDQSKLVPLLVAALQEAIGRIEALEASLA